ncbi:hypothetical protein RQP46_002326 [Phenoliferia psychrophenolica]
MTRLQQFQDVAALQLQMVQLMASPTNLAQTQLSLLSTTTADQGTQLKTVTLAAADVATDVATLAALVTSFAASTGISQDGAAQALIDCFLPLTAVSG